jgi:hypothetical protein
MPDQILPKHYPEKYVELRQSLLIDLLNLDHEILCLPQLIQDAAEIAATADEAESSAKHIYEVISAEVSSLMRDMGGTKPPSETQISARLPLNIDVQEARKNYDTSKFDSKIWSAMVSSLREKSKLLQKTSDLIMAGFISQSSAYEKARRS